MDKIKIVSTKDFENYINSKIDGLNFEVSKNKPIEIQPEQIEMLCKLFQNKSTEWSYDFIKVLLNDILKSQLHIMEKYTKHLCIAGWIIIACDLNHKKMFYLRIV